MRISNNKKERISEQILVVLYSNSPKPLFTLEVAEEIVRDEEFVKSLLLNLKKRGLIIEVKKNPKGIPYLKRSRWALTDAVYNAYKEHQKQQEIKFK